MPRYCDTDFSSWFSAQYRHAQASFRIATVSGLLRMFTGAALPFTEPADEVSDDVWLRSWVFAMFEPWFTSAATGAKDVRVAPLRL